MTVLFGRSLEAARKYVGSFDQVARIDQFVEDDGPARGSRRVMMITGGGLEVDIHPDRALDLGRVTYDGIPVAWLEAQGIVSPAYFDANGSGWLRTFGGGLLTTCGLDAYGSPSSDAGLDFGQHGRVSGIPARMITTSSENGRLVVEGLVRQSTVGGENLTLRRRIESEMGSGLLRISDVVTNEGSAAAVHMILYHANLGWPLIEEGTVLSLPSSYLEPRDEASREGINAWAVFEPPSVDNAAQVFLHELGRGDQVAVRVENPRIGLALTVAFDRRQLPWLCQWKYLSDGTYVLGIEPMNTRTVTSRAHAREAGALHALEPGESVSYELEFRFERTAVA